MFPKRGFHVPRCLENCASSRTFICHVRSRDCLRSSRERNICRSKTRTSQRTAADNSMIRSDIFGFSKFPAKLPAIWQTGDQKKQVVHSPKENGAKVQELIFLMSCRGYDKPIHPSPKKIKKEVPSPKLTARTWKWMVGILVSFCVSAYFQGRTVSLRECSSATYLPIQFNTVKSCFCRKSREIEESMVNGSEWHWPTSVQIDWLPAWNIFLLHEGTTSSIHSVIQSFS